MWLFIYTRLCVPVFPVSSTLWSTVLVTMPYTNGDSWLDQFKWRALGLACLIFKPITYWAEIWGQTEIFNPKVRWSILGRHTEGQLSFALLERWNYEGWENSSCFTAQSIPNPIGNSSEVSVEIWAVGHQKLDWRHLQAAEQPLCTIASGCY